MCRYCEPDDSGDLETWVSPTFDNTRAYLDRYDDYEWALTSVYDDGRERNIVEISVNYCPICGRELN